MANTAPEMGDIRPLLVKRALDVREAAVYIGQSESTFHSRTRRDPLFIAAAPEVRFGAVKGVRFLIDRLDRYLEAKAAASKPQSEPTRLKRGREERRAQRDPAAAWIPSGRGRTEIGGQND